MQTILIRVGWTLTVLAMLATGRAARAAECDDILQRFAGEFTPLTPGEGKYPQVVSNGVALPPFAIARFEVTQELWTCVMGANPSRWTGDRNAVEQVSWTQANAFCKQATIKLQAARLITPQQVIRLPTEAEWEYAASAGAQTRYCFGDNPEQLDAYAWHTGNAAGNDPPVGAKRSNAWGLYDMHGYVWEWTAASDPSQQLQPPVMRGGSWKDAAEQLTTASRRREPADFRDDAVGFRCVLSTP